MTMPLKVNFSKNEANSTAREVPPSGEYTVAITDGEIKSVQPGKTNSGKPFWQLKYVIQDGAYAGTSLMSSIMLFDGALYSFAQLMRALGYEINEGDFVAPTLDEIIGKQLNVKGYKMPPKTDGERELPERFEIKGYKAAKAGAGKTSTNSSLLP
jgi:Protein of unknown function (DUF669)